MKQQYVLLRKENDLLNALKGQSFNQKSKNEAYKILQQIHEKSDYISAEKALCYIVKDGMIKGVGGSSLMQNKKTGKIHSDLILDNFGIWFSGVCIGGIVGAGTVFLTNTAGASKGVVPRNAGTSLLYNSAASFRVLLQVGAGTTTPARTDFAIETVFGTSPENTFFDSNDPVYNNTNFNFKNSGEITAGGSGTVNESVILSTWRDSANSSQLFTLFRDIISPGQAFVVSESIFLEYTTQI